MIVPGRNAIIALSLIVVVGAWGWHQQRGIHRQRVELAMAERALAETQRHQAETTQQLEDLRQELATQQSQRDAALMAAVSITRQKIGGKTETDWTQPPASWPSWGDESPYVWLRKEELARLGVPAFTTDGSLTPELCTLLDLQPAARIAVADLARRLRLEWRRSETEMAARSEQHPSDIGKGEGATVTVRIPPQPELAARLREEFNAALLEILGEQRARLLKGFARRDIVMELGPEPGATEPPLRPKTFSVRRDGNTFHIVMINNPMGTSLSTTSPDWRKNIPAHLHAPFTETFGD